MEWGQWVWKQKKCCGEWRWWRWMKVGDVGWLGGKEKSVRGAQVGRANRGGTEAGGAGQ